MLRLAWIILLTAPGLLAGPVLVTSTTTTTTTTTSTAAPLPTNATDNNALLEIPRAQNNTISCVGRENTFYVIGCSNIFTECHLGTAYKKACPSNLYFYADLGRCEHRKEIPQCKNPKDSAGKIFASPPEFDCSERKDGYYSHPQLPCDKSYYVCLGGRVMRMACGYQQFFDVPSKKCEFKSRVPACKQGIKISGVLPPSPYQLPSQALGQDQPAPPAPPPAEITANQVPTTVVSADGPPDCSTLADGVFADSRRDCVPHFWKCAHKTLFKYNCQQGLFYDKETDRCDHKKFIPSCGGVRQVTTTTSSPAQDVPVDFDCSGRNDGKYVKENCSPVFYSCLAQTVKRLACNDGLVYDQRVEYCDYPLACQGERTTTERPPPGELTNIIQADATVAPINFDCSSKDDGRYPLDKCIRDYAVCTNGAAKRMSCPATLVFNGEHCDFSESCLNPPAPTAPVQLPSNEINQDTPASAQPPAINPYPTVPARTTQAPSTVPAQSQPQIPAGQISCSSLDDGPQAVAKCSNSYVMCLHGSAVAQTCQTGLIYNPYEKYCDYPEGVKDCGSGAPVGQDVPLMQASTTTQTPLLPSNPYGQQTPSQDVPAPQLDKCSGLANGIYAQGCSPFYIQCIHGKSYKQPCPDGLYYNVKKSICDHKTVIVACGGKDELLTTTTTTTTSAPLLPAADDTDDQLNMIGNQCTESSIKNSGCNTYYFHCVFGKIARVQCAPSLYYNPDNHSCDYKSNIPACGGAAPTPAAEQPSLATSPYGSASSGAVGEIPQSSPADNFCVSKENGFYALGCQTYGYACVVGSTMKFNCPGGTFFNPDNNKCEWKDDIPICGGSARTTSAPVTQNLPSIEGAGQQLPADTQVLPFCERLADGYYADGCNAFFYYCRSSETQKLLCPSGTFYNVQKKDCGRKEDVPACNIQTLPAASPAQLPAASPYQIPQTTVAPQQQAPAQTSKFDCSGKNDGLYDLPECTPIFIQCYNGATVVQNCQQGLFYNVQNGMCDYAERVPICGGSLPSSSTTTTTTTPAPVQQNPVTARPYPAEQIAADLPVDASCSGKADGYYVDSCDRRYYSCHGGNLIQHKCQHNLRFDVKNLRCNFPEMVEMCGGKPEEEDATTTTAPVNQLQQDSSPISFDCSSKSDGLFSLSPCGASYVACSNGRALKRQCSTGLFFDETKNFCDFSARVAACGSQPVAPAQDVPVQTYGGSAPAGPAPPAPPPPAQEQPSFSCSGLSNGFYKLKECNSQYISCSNGKAYVGTCPEKLVFDAVTQLCDWPRNTEGCPSFVPQPSSTPASPQQSQPQPSYPAQLPAKDQPSFSCSGLSDGFYKLKECNNQYVQCSSQNAILGNCPEMLVFNAASNACDYTHKTEGCPSFVPEVATTTTTLAPALLPQPLPTLIPQPLPPQQSQPQNPYPAAAQSPPTIPSDFSCSGQNDGIYGSVCALQYWKCSGGMTFPQRCAPGQVFDGVSGGCNFPAKISSCQPQGM